MKYLHLNKVKLPSHICIEHHKNKLCLRKPGRFKARKFIKQEQYESFHSVNYSFDSYYNCNLHYIMRTFLG